MSDLISRQAAIDAFDKEIWSNIDIPICKEIRSAVKKTIEQIPSADLQPWEELVMKRFLSERKTGRWIVNKSPDDKHCSLVKCPFCSEELIAEPNEYSYCPNCGAKMEVEHE